MIMACCAWIVLIRKRTRGIKGKWIFGNLNDVVAVTLPHSGRIVKSCMFCVKKSLNVEYMYALCTKTDEAAIVIKPSDPKKAEEYCVLPVYISFAL